MVLVNGELCSFCRMGRAGNTAGAASGKKIRCRGRFYENSFWYLLTDIATDRYSSHTRRYKLNQLARYYVLVYCYFYSRLVLSGTIRGEGEGVGWSRSEQVCPLLFFHSGLQHVSDTLGGFYAFCQWCYQRNADKSLPRVGAMCLTREEAAGQHGDVVIAV